MKTKYVVDTCFINKLVDGSINIDELPTDGQFIASHIQIDEINKTKDEERRARLFLVFTKTIDEIVPTESFVVGKTRIGEGKLGNGEIYNEIRNKLNDLNGGKTNNTDDALIAEVASKNGYILLTADYHLYEVTQLYDIGVKYWQT